MRTEDFGRCARAVPVGCAHSVPEPLRHTGHNPGSWKVISGINNAGQIIGTYLHQRPGSDDPNDYDSEIAFLYDNGSFTPLDFPGAQAPFLCCGATTLPMDINNVGQIMGSTYGPGGDLRFFLYDDGEYLLITGLPDNLADFSSAWGLSDQSEIAGTYTQRVPCDNCGIGGEPGQSLILHSFVASPKRSVKRAAIN